MVKEEVLGWIPLEFVLCAAISGLLVDLLKEDISCENILIGMVGNSSTGKTTGGLLGVSCGAVPDFKDYTLVFNLMSTANSLMKLIPNSYPCLLDEGSLIPDNKNLTQFLCLLFPKRVFYPWSFSFNSLNGSEDASITFYPSNYLFEMCYSIISSI